jgi:L-iditol 2-dehydrogenase
MRVAMYYRNRDIRLERLPDPRPGPGELLVRIQASGICGSDVLEWYRVHKAPLVLGHEIAGDVIEVGPGVTAFREGDRVTATHHVPCLTCHFCLNGHETVCDTLLSGTHFDPGGFCELVRLPAVNVERGTWTLPEGVSYDEATFVEPLACVLRGQRLAGVGPARSVLVLGSGISGQLHIRLARALGATRIAATDVSDYRLEAALASGADHVFRADQDVPALFREVNRGDRRPGTGPGHGGAGRGGALLRPNPRGGDPAPVHQPGLFPAGRDPDHDLCRGSAGLRAGPGDDRLGKDRGEGPHHPPLRP